MCSSFCRVHQERQCDHSMYRYSCSLSGDIVYRHVLCMIFIADSARGNSAVTLCIAFPVESIRGDSMATVSMALHVEPVKGTKVIGSIKEFTWSE